MRFILDRHEPCPIPVAGTILAPGTPRARAWYRVTDCIEVDSRVWHDRWRLTVVRIDPPTDAEQAAAPAVIPVVHYRRGEGPRDWR